MIVGYALEFSTQARHDIANIRRYIRNVLRGPAAADNITSKIKRAADAAARSPYGYPVIRSDRKVFSAEYRKIPAARYIVVYTIDEDKRCVTIVSVVHSLQDYERSLP